MGHNIRQSTETTAQVHSLIRLPLEPLVAITIAYLGRDRRPHVLIFQITPTRHFGPTGP